MSKVRDQKFKFWADHKKNCLFYGRAGVGKTAILRETLERFGLKFGESVAYYSTHDNGFIGDPTKAEVILFDDLNDPQAQKAAHEVSGLKVWKGVPVTAYVWGTFTIAPDGSEDPLLSSAFEVICAIPYDLHKEWFIEQFGEKLTAAAVEWWEDLNDDAKNLVSPKAVANALTIYKQRGDMRDVLPMQCNVAKLAMLLNVGPIVEKLEELSQRNDPEATRHFLANENNLHAAMKYIPKSTPLMEIFLPLIPKERLVSFMWDDDRLFRHVLTSSQNPYYRTICKEILQANTNVKLCKKIRRWLVENEATARDFVKE